MALDDKIKDIGQEINIQEKTELGEVMQSLDSDTLDTGTGMSSIDFNTRLGATEISSIMIIDELTRLGILPQNLGISRQKKRLAVSLDGKGRGEKVQIVQGQREHTGGGKLMGGLKGLFQRQ